MKKVYYLLAVLFLSGNAIAQTKNNQTVDPRIESITAVGDKLIVKLACPESCFKNNVVGMHDNTEQSIARSKKDGIAAQYLLYPDTFKKINVDEKQLAEDVNDTLKQLGDYYKTISNDKGTLIIHFTYFPGYKKPFQYDLTKAKPEYVAIIKQRNEEIKQRTKCNKQGFCFILGIDSIKYTDSKNKNLKFNDQEFSEFQKKYPNNNLTHFHSAKENLWPIDFYVITGTNGYHTSIEELKGIYNSIVGK